MPKRYEEFDPNKEMNALMYLRMSSDKQNPRSPEQQDAMIRLELDRRKYPWKVIKSYSDSGKSARYEKNRPQFKQMLIDMKAGIVDSKVVLVDTFERFSRKENANEIRQNLYKKYGITVLCADAGFTFPHSQHGQLMTMFEGYRASEECRLKAHNVIRGKMDAAKLKRWPGGPVPLGYKLKLESMENRGGRIHQHHKLVFDPATQPFVQRLLRKALSDPSMGQDSLTIWWTSQPDLPEHLRSKKASAIGRILTNAIYAGVYYWGKYTTDIEDDSRILIPNEEAYVTRVEDFCEPMISWEEYENLKAFRQMRATNSSMKKTRGPGLGIAYQYSLTGLVRCGECHAAMVPNGSGAYETKVGDKRRYVAYCCAGARTGHCSNKVRVKEEWLRQEVVSKLTERLFPVGEEPNNVPWLKEVDLLVKSYLDQLSEQEDVARPALEEELRRIRDQNSGFMTSLGKSNLLPALRKEIEHNFGLNLERISHIENLLHIENGRQNHVSQMLDPKKLLASRNQLWKVLQDDNPTLANVMLSMHIDRVDVYPDGEIVSRICRLGSCVDAIEWFGCEELSTDSPQRLTTPRRRTKANSDQLQLPGVSNLSEVARLATDPNRFSGMPQEWFWVDYFKMPERTSWTKENAPQVVKRYLEIQAATGRSPNLNALAREFGVSRPTITTALDYANRDTPKAATNHHRIVKKVKDNPELEKRIEEMHDARIPEVTIASELGIGRSTVTAALQRIYRARGITKPDGRKTRHQ